MINYLVGEIAYKSENLIVIEIGGVGYEIGVSMTTLDSLPPVGSVCKVYTYLNVREDELSLFGFSSVEEKEMFLKLISVSGIGPRVALSILSGIRLSDLAVAIKLVTQNFFQLLKALGKRRQRELFWNLKIKFLSLASLTSSLRSL